MEGQGLPLSSAQQASGCDTFLRVFRHLAVPPQNKEYFHAPQNSATSWFSKTTFFFFPIEYSSDINKCKREAIFLRFYTYVT